MEINGATSDTNSDGPRVEEPSAELVPVEAGGEAVEEPVLPVYQFMMPQFHWHQHMEGTLSAVDAPARNAMGQVVDELRHFVDHVLHV